MICALLATARELDLRRHAEARCEPVQQADDERLQAGAVGVVVQVELGLGEGAGVSLDHPRIGVLDADGLNAFAGNPSDIAAALRSRPSGYGLMLREQYVELQRVADFSGTLIAEYPYGKWRYALVRSAAMP